MQGDHQPGPDDSLRHLSSAARGGGIGGPGFIFVLLLLLIGAGAGLYLVATGTLERWLAPGSAFNFGLLGEDGAGNATPTPAPAPTGSPATPGSQALVLAAMGPSELMQARTPPRSQRLAPGAFDLPPVQRFARPALFLGQKPRLGVMIVNLGHNLAVTAAAVADTPPEITLSFSPYAPDLAAWIDAAHAFGHEVMLDLPLESRAYPQEDPGPLGLLTALNADENGRRLAALLASAEGVLGFATQRGDRFLTDATALRPVLAEIARRGLGLVIARPGANALREAESGLASLPPRIGADIELAHDLSRQALAAALESAMVKARDSRRALVVVQPYPLSIAALTNLAALAKDRDLALVPASALMSVDQP
ncbi:MAG: divergent polysaccharide deacetylase family protein [Rhodospirillaceae bacterium]|nr:divergent polysaccharide deacetylase family protein [Rhodospirillaceae bacterium]